VTFVYGQQGTRERPTKALRLLGFLEQEEKFIKFLQRDFKAFLPDKRTAAAAVAAAVAESGKKSEEESQAETKKDGEPEQGEEDGEADEDETSRLHRSLQSAITAVVTEKERQAKVREREQKQRQEEQAAKRHKANDQRDAAYGPAESAQSNRLGAQAAVVLAESVTVVPLIVEIVVPTGTPATPPKMGIPTKRFAA
jgi:hypothetical protein